MSPRLLALALLAGACQPPEAPGPPPAAVAQLQPVGGDGAVASLRIEEQPQGLVITDPGGALPHRALTAHVVEACTSPEAAPHASLHSPERPEALVATAPPTVDPTLAAPPEGEDAGTTAGMKGMRAGGSDRTADQSGQAADPMRPTTATPAHRSVELTPTEAGGWTAAGLTLEELLGRAVSLEGGSGPMCGVVRPATSAAPGPAG